MVENFNSCILDARYMPIRTIIEFIRKKTVNRLGMKGLLCEKWISCFNPIYNEIFHINKGLAMGL